MSLVNRLIPGRLRYEFRTIGGMDLVRNSGHDAFTLSQPQRSLRLATESYYREIGYLTASGQYPIGSRGENNSQVIRDTFANSVLRIFDSISSTERGLMSPWNFRQRTQEEIARDMRWIAATAILHLSTNLPQNGRLYWPYSYNYEVTGQDALFLARDCIVEGIQRSNELQGLKEEDSILRTRALELASKIFSRRGRYLEQRDILEVFVNEDKPVRRNIFLPPSV